MIIKNMYYVQHAREMLHFLKY
ncbi:hypothetical protein PFFCH_00908 [Plasmodium falciparum FCH/4]|uniref:Uncharacterized protein n=1 Tax=Plasmodium falciparum FCH/4 TaxID=1036724 RepID=A0A024VTV6_PLAFA|nr:hypothetical protein PFFCH_00908 [Plasmodium falciparum FCH/4]